MPEGFDPNIDDRISGNRGRIFYSSYIGDDPPTESDAIPIMEWSAKVRKHFHDTTDSRSYHRDQGILYTTRSPAVIDVEATISGRFRVNVIPYTFIEDLFFGEDHPSRIALWLNNDSRFCYGLFTVHDFSCDLSMLEIAMFRASIKSYGAIELGPFVTIDEPRKPPELGPVGDNSG